MRQDGRRKTKFLQFTPYRRAVRVESLRRRNQNTAANDPDEDAQGAGHGSRCSMPVSSICKRRPAAAPGPSPGMDKRLCLEPSCTNHPKETLGFPTDSKGPSKQLFPMGTVVIGQTDQEGSFGGFLTSCPPSIHIDPQRKQMCAVHALRNVVQDKAGDVITDALLVAAATQAAGRLEDTPSMHYDELQGGNFSIEAICDAVGMLDNFSIRELKWHWLGLPATDFCRAAFADVENLPVAGLVLHVSKRSHYVAVLRQDTSDAAQILLLDSVYPDRIEILSPQQFHVVAS